MVLPKSMLYYPLTVDYDPQTVFANADLTKWENSQFLVGSVKCRLVATKLYRWCVAREDIGPEIWEKSALIAAVFSPRDQMRGANINYVGRHIVNSVCYQPVQQKRTKVGGRQEARMCWRFNSKMDLQIGIALQIGVWLPDHMLRHYEEYRGPEDFKPTTLQRELDNIVGMTEEELEEDIISRGY